MKTNLKQTGVWLDGTKAIIIELQQGQVNVRELEADIDNPVHHKHQGKKGTFMGTQHVNDEKKFQSKKNHEINRYLDQVIDEIKDANELYIMGPSVTKMTLKAKVEENAQLRDKLKGVHAMDYVTLNQTVAEVKRYFSQAEQ